MDRRMIAASRRSAGGVTPLPSNPLRQWLGEVARCARAVGSVGLILVPGMTLAAPLAAQDAAPRQGPPTAAAPGSPILLSRGDSTGDVDRPFDTWTLLLPARRGVTIWARNTSVDTIVITELSLSACFNLSTPCGPASLNLVLGAGDSAEVITLRPKVWDDQFSYKPGWKWIIPGASGPAVDTSAGVPPLPFEVWAAADSGHREVILMARNTSSTPIVVTGLVLSNCENLEADSCREHPLSIRLLPDAPAATVAVRPTRWGEPYRFDLHWSWARATNSR